MAVAFVHTLPLLLPLLFALDVQASDVALRRKVVHRTVAHLTVASECGMGLVRPDIPLTAQNKWKIRGQTNPCICMGS